MGWAVLDLPKPDTKPALSRNQYMYQATSKARIWKLQATKKPNLPLD